MKYARVINGLVVALAEGSGYENIDETVKDLWIKVPEQVGFNWRKINGVWTAPPEDPPGLSADYYIAKVTFERRFDDDAFAVLDAVRITVRNRPAEWATTSAAPWPVLKPFVRALSDYDAADRINVADPAIAVLLDGLQADRQLFGEDPEAAAAKVARILTPGPLPGEPAP